MRDGTAVKELKARYKLLSFFSFIQSICYYTNRHNSLSCDSETEHVLSEPLKS